MSPPHLLRLLFAGPVVGASVVAACGTGRIQAINDAGGGNDAATQPEATTVLESSTDGDGSGQDAGPPACPATCGPTASESCCSSEAVPGGTFFRSYDGTTCDTLIDVCFTDRSWPATVSDFRLDRFEVTIGRYRPFATAVEGGWHPAPGAGKHTHLNGGLGVSDSASDAGVAYETGWDPGWDAMLQQSISAPDAGACPELQESDFTSSPGPNENRPVSCVTWWTAYAFCIWDGGFLPTEAEWNYAASGGSQQRIYPWGSHAIDCTNANFDWCLLSDAGLMANGTYVSVAGAYSPAGDGIFGQADLEGNVSEWTLDSYAPYVTPCIDCAFVSDLGRDLQRVLRGAAFDQSLPYITPVVSERNARQPQIPLSTGIRCARTP